METGGGYLNLPEGFEFRGGWMNEGLVNLFLKGPGKEFYLARPSPVPTVWRKEDSSDED